MIFQFQFQPANLVGAGPAQFVQKYAFGVVAVELPSMSRGGGRGWLSVR